MNYDFRLTQFSPGAGCGCKIAPKELEVILQCDKMPMQFANLLVGNESRDDAAVYDIGNGNAIVSTTDFFTPIVDKARDFGRIAAVNAISDVYAMGGIPMMALALLGWPLHKLPAALAREVVEGAREVCNTIKIPLAGGHSIDIDTPVFGLAVTGMVRCEHVKRNCTATPGCKIFLTKPLGIGIVTTAEKMGKVRVEDAAAALGWMTKLNDAGCDFARLIGVRAMTDVTGFGLLGHSIEMAEGSNVQIILNYNKLPLMTDLTDYTNRGCVPGGTERNWNSYGQKAIIYRINEDEKSARALLCDPQTGGGLLVAVEPGAVEDLQKAALKTETQLFEIGYTTEHSAEEAWVRVIKT